MLNLQRRDRTSRSGRGELLPFPQCNHLATFGKPLGMMPARYQRWRTNNCSAPFSWRQINNVFASTVMAGDTQQGQRLRMRSAIVRYAAKNSQGSKNSRRMCRVRSREKFRRGSYEYVALTG